MAIIPETQYPGQTTPASTNYPYGSARDVSSPGAGDGTPVQQAWVNDWLGFQQAAMQAAGVTPSGNPDNATLSDVLNAILAISQKAENLIINGGFIINQRGYVSGVSLSAGTYGHDRWKAGSGGASYTFGSTAETISITTGTVQQIIEGLNNPGGDITVSWVGTAQCRVNGGSYSSSPLKVSGITAGTNITVEFGVGTVSRVQCSPGTVELIYRRRQYSDELMLCQRYYQASTSGTTGTFAPSGSDSHTAWFMKVTMRSSPTAFLSGGVGTVYQLSPDYVDVKITSGASSYAVIVNIKLEAEL